MVYSFIDLETTGLIPGVEQIIYVESIFNNQMTIVNAPSGTGKTTLAVAVAKIIGKPLFYVFSPVEEGKMGFREGSQAKKESAYLAPLLDALIKIGEQPDKVVLAEATIKEQKFSGAWVFPKSHTFLRGSNLEDTTVIFDEFQNWTISEAKKALTRVHDNCKTIVIGHSGQIDLKNPKDSCLERVVKHFENEPYAQVCELTVNFRGALARHADKL